MADWLIAGACAVLLAAFAWPRYGLWSRWRRARQLASRCQREDLLKHILKCEANGRVPTVDSIAGALQITTGDAADLLAELEDRGLLSSDEGRLRLKPEAASWRCTSFAPIASGKATWRSRPACPKPNGTAGPNGRNT